jgi:Undecaprenyl-phosphate galactose phosphotransferase WbaP
MRFFLFLTDLIAFVLAFVFARLLVFQFSDSDFAAPLLWWKTQGQIRTLLYGALTMLALAWIHGYYRHYILRKPYWTEVRELLVLVVFVAVLDATFMYLAKFSFSRLAWLINWTLLLPFILVLRFAIRSILNKLGFWHRPYVVIGCGENAKETIAAISEDKWMGYGCIAALSVSPNYLELNEDKEKHDSNMHLLGIGDSHFLSKQGVVRIEAFPKDINAFLQRWRDTDIFVAVEEEEWSLLKDVIDHLAIFVPHLYVVPPLRGLPLLGTDVSHFFSHEVLLLRVRNNLGRRSYQKIKRGIDIMAVIFGSIIVSPLLVSITWLVWRGGGEVIFGHERIGQHGRTFRCYKFTTMVPNAQQMLQELLLTDEDARVEWEQSFKLANDPRVTAFGAFMRRTSLDELPQLWNVLMGDMSLVGPRPIIDSELSRYGDYQKYYLEAKPGMTGLWQVSGRSNTDYPTRVALDVWYVKNWSLWYDFVILIKTIKVVLARKGAH